MPACSYNHIRYAEIDSLQGERKLWGYCPIHATLPIRSRVTSRPAGRARQRDIRNDIDCIGGRLSPLLGGCKQYFDLIWRLEGEGLLEGGLGFISRIYRRRGVVAVRKQRVECAKATTR